jgi:hypothetical protein
MNKKILLSILIFASIFIAGCGNKKVTQSVPVNIKSQADIKTQAQQSTNTTNTTNNTIDTTKGSTANEVNATNSSIKNNSKNLSHMSYQLTKCVYKFKNVTIYYPQITGLSGSNNLNTINTLIKNDAFSCISGSIDNNLSLQINYNVTLSNSNLLSVKYTGQYYVNGTNHPTHLFYTTNIDIKNGTKLKLSDLVTVNKSLADNFKEGTYIPWMTLANSQDNKQFQSTVINFVNSINDNDLIASLNRSGSKSSGGSLPSIYSPTYCYLTRNTLGISISTSSVMGDHIEYEIKYNAIPNNINSKNEVWKSILGY